jgi:hypothetical protein
MRKILLSCSLLCAAVSYAQSAQEPVFTLTVEAGEGREISIGANAVTSITVDYGDGETATSATTQAYDGWDGAVTFTHSFKDASTVKVYGEGLIYVDAYSKVDGASITAADFSKATDLTDISIYGNKRLTSLVLPESEALTKLEINNTGLTSVDITKLPNLASLDATGAQLTSLDLSKSTALTSLKLNDCPWESTTIDLSANTALKSMYLLNMGLESITVGVKPAKSYISLNNNKLTTLDVSEADLAAGSLLAMYNNLTSIKYNKIKTLNVTGNQFTLSTLPYENITNLTYTNQQAMPVTVSEGTVDLSSEYSVKGIKSTDEAKTTTYTWKDSEGTALVAGEDYTEENGVFTFLKAQENIYCEMSNAAFPATTFKTETISVSATSSVANISVAANEAVQGVYTIDGRFVGKSVENLAPGMYLVKTANSVKKIVSRR